MSVGMWIASLAAIEGIKLAIEEVGFENLTGRAVRDGLANIRDWDTGFGYSVTMSDDSPWYLPFLRIESIKGGEYFPVTDWIEPPFRFESRPVSEVLGR